MDTEISVLPGGKSFEITNKFDDLSTKLYCMKRLQCALKACNKSIALAPYNSVELFNALAKKTLILYDMGRKDICVENIDFILQHPKCPIWITTELIDRKTKCMTAIVDKNTDEMSHMKTDYVQLQPDFANDLNDISNECVDFNLSQTIMENEASQNFSVLRNKFSAGNVSYSKVSSIKNSTDEMEPLIDGIAVIINKQFGRHIVATQDLQPGEVLVKEKSVFCSLFSEEVFDHCSNCLVRSGLLIPCRKCSKAMFCSEHCLCDASNQYHTIECALMEYFATLDAANSHIPLVIRLLSILSKQGTYLEKLEEKWEELKQKGIYYPKQTDEFLIPEDLITTIFNLESYKFTEEEYFRNTFKFSKLVGYMKEHTKFFLHVQNYRHKRLENFVISLLVDLEARCRCYVYAVTEKIFDKTKKYPNVFFLDNYINQKTIGFSFCKFLSYFNHSCVPNAVYSFQDGNHVIVCSLRSIKCGEQISLCYTGYKGMYHKLSKSKRQKELKKYFDFICKCAACEFNWPIEMKSLNKIIKRRYNDECCYCNIDKEINVVVQEINTLGSENAYTDVCDAIGQKIVQSIQLLEEFPIPINNLFSVKEYVLFLDLFYAYIEAFSNSYPDYI